MKSYQTLLERPTRLFQPLMVIALLIIGSTANTVFAQSWNEVIKLVDSDVETNDRFGHSVAISGDYAIVSAHYDDYDESGLNYAELAGAAFILKNDSGNWSVVQKLVASDRASEDDFGYSVAISGEYAIVGARHEDDPASGNTRSQEGAAYIFKNNAGSWSEVQKIVATNREEGDQFGYSVAISGGHAIVGAYGADKDAAGGNDLTSAGAAYIFKNNTGTWSQVKKVVASDRISFARFGNSVAISGNQAVVGARRDHYNSSGGDSIYWSGSAYLFENNAGTWSETQKIVASDRGKGDQFGWSVGISSDVVIVGAGYEQHNTTGGDSLYRAGSAYIFENNGGNWSEVQKLVASDRDARDNFGCSVAISGDSVAIVGARNEEHDASGGNIITSSGSAYIFENNAGTWSEAQKIVASDREIEDWFGHSVGISGSHAIVSAHLKNITVAGGATRVDAGAAYIFGSDTSNSGNPTDTTNVGVVNQSFEYDLVVYPNPTNGKFTIDLGANLEKVKITIVNLTGSIVYSQSFSQTQLIPIKLDKPTGIYLMTISADEKKTVVRLVKE